jgi:phage terminase small subunit
MKNSAPKAPEHLRLDTKAWWASVHANWRLEEHHSRLLTMAAEAWDRACQAREILADDGILLGGREGGSRPHPAIAIERDSRIAFARLIAQLNLDGEAPQVDPNVRSALRSSRPGGWRASNGQTVEQHPESQRRARRRGSGRLQASPEES